MPELDDFQQSCLEAHNTLRQEHGAESLEWNTDLASSAQDWADRIAKLGYLQHSDNSRLGENITITEDDEPSGSKVVDQWAEEEALYDYSNPKWQRGTSHFTQIIWKSSADIGIGRAKLQSTDTYVTVVHYKPTGNTNIPGEYRTNVFPKGTLRTSQKE